MATPRWDNKKSRWVLDVCVDGIRKQFTSAQEGRKGLKEVNTKYQAWLMNETSGDKTVEQVAKQYLNDLQARRGVKCPAYTQYESYFRLHIFPKVGKYKMSKVTLRMWQSVLNEAKGRRAPLSEKVLENIMSLINALVKYGYQNYECDLLRGELFVPIGHPKREIAILTKREVKRLFDYETKKFYYPLFCWLICTGMRPGEGLGLQVGDIYEDGIIIRRSVNKDGVITNCKNENARRMIPIGKTARQLLNQTIERNKALKLDTEWIFCSPDGSVGNQSTMRNHWSELKKELGLNPKVTSYGLRHTFVSMMKGVLPEQIIKDIVGHSVSMDTFGVYGHIVEGEAREAAEIIDLTFNSITQAK